LPPKTYRRKPQQAHSGVFGPKTLWLDEPALFTRTQEVCGSYVSLAVQEGSEVTRPEYSMSAEI